MLLKVIKYEKELDKSINDLLIPPINDETLFESFKRWHNLYGKGALIVEEGSRFCPLLYEYVDESERPRGEKYQPKKAMSFPFVRLVINCCQLSDYGVIVINTRFDPEPIIMLLELRENVPEFTEFTGSFLGV